MTRSIARAFVLVSTLVCAGGVSAQSFPSKPLHILTTGAGAGNDTQARIIGAVMGPSLGQPVIIENRAGGTPLAEAVARAAPDGYTMLYVGYSFIVGPLLEGASYDPLRDFAPVSLVCISPSVLVTNPGLAANSVKELIAMAKAQPGVLNYGSGPSGGGPHLSAELFKAMAGVNIVRIPYKNVGPALNAVMSGEVQLMFPLTTQVAPLIKSGKFKALAVTSAQPSALVPGLPTIAATGLPGYDSTQLSLAALPARTPADIVRRLNRELVQSVNRPDIKEKFFNSGAEVVGSTPEVLTERMKAELAVMGKVIKDAGIRAE